MIERCDLCRKKHKHEFEEMSNEQRDDYINYFSDGLKDMCNFVDDGCELIEEEKYIHETICLGQVKNAGLKYFMELNL